MGCDIHCYAETYNIKTKEYEFLPNELDENNSWFSDRNYVRFSIMAGVRNDNYIKPIATPRKFPQDACDEIKEKKKSWDADAHSHSFLWLNEIIEYRPTKKCKIENFDSETFWGDELERLKEYNHYEPVRLVFWFDN
jgi:hypothetical protein